MLKLLFKDVVTRKMLVNFRELTSYLMNEAGMDDTMPDKAEKKAPIVGIILFFVLFILGRTEIFWAPIQYMINKFATEANVIFLILPFISIYLALGIGYILYQIWAQNVMKTELGALVPLAERSIAALKAAGRDDLEEDIEDAEFLVEDYKKRFGF